MFLAVYGWRRKDQSRTLEKHETKTGILQLK
jgi:hypothetical protein